MKPNTLALSAILLPLSALSALSGEAKAPVQKDKSQYNLFNPTPTDQLRDMSTDRPDKTESPYTVDAGHFQFEMDFVNYTRDHDRADGANTITQGWGVAPINLKVGLFNNVDLQVVIEPYNQVTTRDLQTGLRTHQSGFGDITGRLKINLWGNDGGKTALALMPFVKIPTNQDDLGNNSVEGGLIIPLAVELPGGFGLGLMTEFDVIRNESDSGYHAEFINSVTLSHDIVGKLGGYVEFFSAISAESSSDWVGTVDLGLTYAVTDNIQLDAGVNIGVTDSADDFAPFVGLSVRF